MERTTQRIVAVVIIAAVVIAGGIGAWIFLLQPGAGLYAWSASDCPGAPAGISESQIIKVGVLGDMGEIQGDGAWEGAWLAARDLNQAGGIVINNSQDTNTPNGTYYFGVTKEDTDEANPNLVTSRGIAAAERIVYNKDVDISLGGFRSEALLAYREVLMDNKIPFINTGAATDIFCESVGSWYARYKYFFRNNPINSTSLGGQALPFLINVIDQLNQSFPNTNISKVGLLYEDLTWTTDTVDGLTDNLPLYSGTYLGWDPAITIEASIGYDVTLSSGDMKIHMDALEAAGCQVVIPIISAQGGIMMMNNYATEQYEFVIVGIDVQSQTSEYWDDTGGDCVYETMMQSCTETNKTSKTLAFWGNFTEKWLHDPLYTATGSYDAMYMFAHAIIQNQSISALNIVDGLESITKDAPVEGVAGILAFTGTHDILAGWPYGTTLFAQWQPGGEKHCVSASGAMDALTGGPIYPDNICTGTYITAPWVNTTWS